MQEEPAQTSWSFQYFKKISNLVNKEMSEACLEIIIEQPVKCTSVNIQL